MLMLVLFWTEETKSWASRSRSHQKVYAGSRFAWHERSGSQVVGLDRLVGWVFVMPNGRGFRDAFLGFILEKICQSTLGKCF